MTDEERQKLCNRLRQPPTIDFANTCEDAADEIERLARRVEELMLLMLDMEIPDR